jgi:hypothetical protein
MQETQSTGGAMLYCEQCGYNRKPMSMPTYTTTSGTTPSTKIVEVDLYKAYRVLTIDELHMLTSLIIKVRDGESEVEG